MIRYEMFDFVDVFQDLENNKSEKGRKEILDKWYPPLYLWLLKRRGMHEAAEKYLEENKNCKQ